MAGQKKDASTSILRRVLDHTPIRPGRLENFRPQTLNAAQFAARYFNREGGIIQRLLGIGGDFSPIHRAIGRSIFNRFTDFNQSFGPIQRALRPQPEHKPHRRPQLEAGQVYDGYEAEDAGYYPEPAFFEQPAPLSSYQNPQNAYAYHEPATVPWESPLNSTPLPVARRVEFQPANLRYLTDPAQPVERQIIQPTDRQPAAIPALDNFRAARPVERSLPPTIIESQVARTTPVFSPDALSDGRSAEQASRSAPEQAAKSNFAQPTAPGIPPSFSANQTDADPGQPNNDSIFAVPSAPLSPQSPTDSVAAARLSENRADSGAAARVSEYREAAYPPAFHPQGQPALSRALQRTFDATAPQTDGFNATISQGSNLGASPAAVARHFAVTPTIARYRAVKQAADKVFLGEQPAREAEQTQSFEPQPLAPIYNSTPVERATLETTLAQEAATRQTTADLHQARRVREETRALLEAQQNATPVAKLSYSEPSQGEPSQGEPSQQIQPLQAQPSPARQANLDAAQPPRNVELPLVPVEPTPPGRVQRATPTAETEQPLTVAPATGTDRSVSTEGTVATELPLAATPAMGTNRTVATDRTVETGQTATLPGATALQRNIQPAPAQSVRSSGLINRPENAPSLFDAGIPASFLENNFATGDTTQEVRRLTGNRLDSPAITSGWANSLAALRNNPGVEARTTVARQLSEPATEGATATDAWTDGGAGVYYDQRRVRRTGPISETFEVAAETQDRIFSLAESPTGLRNFQPQLMQGLAAELAAPVQPTVNRSPFTPPEPAQSPAFTRPNAAEPAITVNREVISPTAPGVNRVFEAGASNAAITPEQPLNAPAQNQYEIATSANRANLTGEAVLTEEAVATGQITSSESADQPPSTQAQVARAASQPEVYGASALEGDQPARVQRISPVTGLQPTALQRVFKRLDLDEPRNEPFGENPGFDFANLPLSYAARPGSRQQRASQQDSQPNFEEFGQPAYSKAAYRQPNFADQPIREASIENFIRPSEPSVARTQVGPEAAVPVVEIAGESSTRHISPDAGNEAVSFAGESTFTSQPGQPVSSQDAPGVQRTVPPESGEGARSSQSQYFANSLESSWLSPENRLLVERLPGGSSALQRLLQAPGQVQAFLEQREGASAANMSLPSLRNNPGLSANVARALEEGDFSGSAGVDGWSDSPALNFVQRRRVGRQVQDSSGSFENGAVPDQAYAFESPLPNPNDLSYASPAQPGTVQPEISRSIIQANQPGLTQRSSTAQPGNFQGKANRETVARLQRAVPTEPVQPAPTAGNFTISSDWVAQLQQRFEGFAIGKLSDSTGQVMRFLNNDAANFAGFGPGQNYEASIGFNYAVPPLLWRKVSDYTPQGGLPANPDLFASSQPGLSYTSPGEVLRAYEQGETYAGLPDEGATPADNGDIGATRQNGSARLDLPRLQQTHQLLQRIAKLEKTNTSLALSQRMDNRFDAAAQATNNVFSPAQTGATPLSLPFAIQRQPGTADRPTNRVEQQSDTFAANRFDGQIENRVDRLIDNAFDNGGEAAEAVASPTPPAPLRMTDVPVNRPGADGRSLAVDSDLFADDGYARPALEIRTIEVRVPDRQTYGTPLETAAARNGTNRPTIGQGEILQPLAIQRKASGIGPSQTASFAPLTQPALHNIIKTSVGQTLDHPVQRKMTDIFGTHFQDVRVHTGDEAAEATRHVGAEAFTLGSDIYFAPGRYQPHSQTGQALIGHELTHIVQQSSLPSLGNGRVPETSSLGQSLEHHAIANEHLLLRHLSNNQDDNDHHHGFISDGSGRLSFQDNHSSSPYSGGTATVERSYQPVSEQNNNPPIKPAHVRSGSNGSGSAVQRAIEVEESSSSSTGGSVSVDDIIKDQEGMDKLARKVYQIMRDELMIERERGFGPGNGKFF